MSTEQESLVGGVITGATGVVDDVVTGVTGVTGGAISGISGVVGGGISDVAGGIGGAIGGPVGSVIGGVGGFAGNVVGGVGGLAGDLVGGVGGIAGDIVGGVGGAIGGGIDSLASGLAGSPPAIPGLPLPGSGGDKDPCNRIDYLKERLGVAPILGNLSLNDIGVSLDNLIPPKIPEIKIPKPGEIIDNLGNAITGGISDMVGDVKAGIGGVLEDLAPDKLLASAKAKLGEVGREALAGAIENKMMDMLGPVKSGLGNQLKRSFKQNMLMLGVEEVANIISGEPNILDPCAGRGKDKIKGLTNDTISAAKGGKAIADLKSSIDLAVDPTLLSNKQLAAAQTAVLGDISLPGAQAAFDNQTAINDAFVAEKVDESIKSTASAAATKALNEDEAAEKPVLTQEEKFPEPEASPDGFTHMVYRFEIMKNNGNWPVKGDLLEQMDKKKSSMIEFFKNWSPGMNKPHECMFGCIGFEISMYIQQWTAPTQFEKLPKEMYVGGVHVSVNRLRMGGGAGYLDSSVKMQDVINSHKDNDYISRVYNLNDSSPESDQYPAEYYSNNILSDCGSHPLSYMWNETLAQLLKIQKRPITMHINRELTNEEIKGPMQFYRRSPLVWSSFDECVDGLIDWLYNYKLQVPVDGNEKKFPYQGAEFRPVKGVYDIPQEFCTDVTILELLDHEMSARIGGLDTREVIKPSKGDATRIQKAVNKYKNNRFRR